MKLTKEIIQEHIKKIEEEIRSISEKGVSTIRDAETGQLMTMAEYNEKQKQKDNKKSSKSVKQERENKNNE